MAEFAFPSKTSAELTLLTSTLGSGDYKYIYRNSDTEELVKWNGNYFQVIVPKIKRYIANLTLKPTTPSILAELENGIGSTPVLANTSGGTYTLTFSGAVSAVASIGSTVVESVGGTIRALVEWTVSGSVATITVKDISTGVLNTNEVKIKIQIEAT